MSKTFRSALAMLMAVCLMVSLCGNAVSAVQVGDLADAPVVGGTVAEVQNKLNARIDSLEATINGLKESIAELQETLDEKSDLIEEMNGKLEEYEAELEDKKAEYLSQIDQAKVLLNSYDQLIAQAEAAKAAQGTEEEVDLEALKDQARELLNEEFENYVEQYKAEAYATADEKAEEAKNDYYAEIADKVEEQLAALEEVKELMTEEEYADALNELQQYEADAKAEVDEAVAEAKAEAYATIEERVADIQANKDEYIEKAIEKYLDELQSEDQEDNVPAVDYDALIQQYEDDQAEIEDKIAEYEAKYDEVTASCDELMEQAHSTIDVAQGAISDAEYAIECANGVIASLEAAVATAKYSVNDMNHTEVVKTLNELTANLYDLLAALEELDYAIDNVAYSIEDTNVAVADLEAKVEELKPVLAEYDVELELEMDIDLGDTTEMLDEMDSVVEKAIVTVGKVIYYIETAKVYLEKVGENVSEIVEKLELNAKKVYNWLVNHIKAVYNVLKQHTKEEWVEILKQKVAAIVEAETHADYTITVDSNMVAIGDCSAISDSYVDLLGAALNELAGTEGYTYDFTNLAAEGTIEDAAAIIAANESVIAAADLVVLGYNDAAVVEEVLDTIVNTMAGEDDCGHDWSALIGEENTDKVINVLEKVYDLLCKAENKASDLYDKAMENETVVKYVNIANEKAEILVNKIINKLNALLLEHDLWTLETMANKADALAELLSETPAGAEATYGEALAAAVECVAYNVIAYALTVPETVNTLQELNADALVVVVGMSNPFEGTVLNYNGRDLNLGKWFGYVVDAANVYGIAHAYRNDNCIYVPTESVESDISNQTINLSAATFYEYLLGDISFHTTEAGHEAVKDYVLDALNITVEGILGDVNCDGVVDSDDAAMVLKYDAELITADDLHLEVGDVDGDGDVDCDDACLILKYDALLIDVLPAAK